MSVTSSQDRAQAIAEAGGLAPALAAGKLDRLQKVSLSEALVLGLLRQGVSKYFAIFGHGSTDLAEVLRVYEQHGVTRTINCRNSPSISPPPTSSSTASGFLSANAAKALTSRSRPS